MHYQNYPKRNLMNKIAFLFFCTFLFFSTQESFAGKRVEVSALPTIEMSRTEGLPNGVSHPQGLSNLKQVQELLGRKLTLKEKFALKILRWKQAKAEPEPQTSSKKGRTSKVLGIVALGAIVIFPLATLVCGILAIVFGQQAKKINPDDKDAKAGVVMGIIAVGLFVLAVVAVIAYLSAFSW